jgi:hypothetical protein
MYNPLGLLFINQSNHPLFQTWYQSLGFDPVATLIPVALPPGGSISTPGSSNFFSHLNL